MIWRQPTWPSPPGAETQAQFLRGRPTLARGLRQTVDGFRCAGRAREQPLDAAQARARAGSGQTKIGVVAVEKIARGVGRDHRLRIAVADAFGEIAFGGLASKLKKPGREGEDGENARDGENGQKPRDEVRRDAPGRSAYPAAAPPSRAAKSRTRTRLPAWSVLWVLAESG